MVTIREYANSHHVSYEAIRSQIARYRDDLEDHIIIKNRIQYLDSWAVEFLDLRRRESPVTIVNQGREDEIAELKAQVESLKAKIADIQEERNRAHLKIEKLQDEARAYLEDKIRHDLVLEDFAAAKEQLQDATTRAAAAEARVEEMTKRTEAAEQTAREERDRLDQFRTEAAAERDKMNDAIREAQNERDQAIHEAQSYHRTWFGLYRKA